MRVTIYADKGWQNTGITNSGQEGMYFRIRTNGSWKFGSKDEFLVNADGMRPQSGAQDYGAWRSTEGKTNFPYSGSGGRLGQLIGRFGERGEPFLAGSYWKVACTALVANEPLWLCINDDGVGDNAGSMDVELDIDAFADPLEQRAYEQAAENDRIKRLRGG